MAEKGDVAPADPDRLVSSSNGASEKQREEGGGTETVELGAKSRRWRFKMRSFDDEEERSWWFASTAIPLLAAALAPLANVLSIAALVTSWRIELYENGKRLAELHGIPIDDPRWIYFLNVVSLLLGFIGNFFLLMNFTNRIRYIISLPMTIGLWCIATAILIAITTCMEIYHTPVRPVETYSQGFWYAVIAAVLYLICTMILMINMLGYFLGHYPQRFQLTDSQRQLILQTMFFFVWLAAGGAVFAVVESTYGENEWKFVDGLYFCDVTVLTVGFGDLYPTNDIGRGLVFPYSVVGIILLGLVISSVHSFVQEIGSDKVIRAHMESNRLRTVQSSVSTPLEMKRRLGHHFHAHHRHDHHEDTEGHHHHRDDGMDPQRHESAHPEISGPLNPIPIKDVPVEAPLGTTSTAGVNIQVPPRPDGTREQMMTTSIRARHMLSMAIGRGPPPKILLLREERDRFNAMRDIQASTAAFKRYSALGLSLVAFGILWCVGAIVFWQCEQNTQGLSYFQALYFGYVSLLTIGYGDLAPTSNPGRAFFVVWSVVAVPTMTVLVSDLGDTLIGSFKSFSIRFADFYLLPQKGAWRSWLNRHRGILTFMKWLVARKRKRTDTTSAVPPTPEASERGHSRPSTNPDATNDDVDAGGAPLPRAATIEELAQEAEADEHRTPPRAELARELARAIRRVAGDLKTDPDRRYTYEEWVAFTRLIRFTGPTHRGPRRHKLDPRAHEVAHAGANDNTAAAEKEGAAGGAKELRYDPEFAPVRDDEGLIEWDWIGPNSPMMAGVGEVEFLLDRLCESLVRYMKRGEEAMRASGVDAATLEPVAPSLMIEQRSGEGERGAEDEKAQG